LFTSISSQILIKYSDSSFCEVAIIFQNLTGKKLIRILREKIRENYHILKNKTNFFSKGIVEQFDQVNNFENYQKNLRYLDLPVQPITDKKGFEIQFLSKDRKSVV
jgi:hypothetical protein